MKNTILLFSVFLLSFGCKPDSENELLNNQLPIIKIDELRPLIPNIYKESSKVIFVNIVGMEKVLSIDYSEEKQNGKTGAWTYEKEKLGIGLTNKLNPVTSLYLHASGNYRSKDESYTFLHCAISPKLGFDPAPLIRIDDINDVFGRAEILPEKKLLDKIFFNVYSALGHENQNAFSELFYTVEEGIVGFRDFQNSLWVLERYE